MTYDCPKALSSIFTSLFLFIRVLMAVRDSKLGLYIEWIQLVQLNGKNNNTIPAQASFGLARSVPHAVCLGRVVEKWATEIA